MSVNYQRDGTVLFISDVDPTVTQLEPANKTPSQIIADYAAFQATWPLTWWKSSRQGDLDTLLDANFDLKAFIRAGMATNVTAAGVGTFLATICNNYRSLRAQISAAVTIADIQSININSGWPANP